MSVASAVVAPPPRSPSERVEGSKISVVIATYQAGDTVAAAVDSALGQTRRPHQVIVVDDGSDDGTVTALARYGEEITLLSQQNRGPSAARNLGIQHATGEYIDILDSDDVFYPGRHNALAAAIEQRPDLGLLVTDVDLELDGKVVATFYTRNEFPAMDQRQAILRRCFVVTPVCVRRDRLLAAGGFDEAIRIGEDWDCWIRMMLAGDRAGLVAMRGARYHMSNTSLSGVRTAQWPARAAVLRKALRDRRLSAPERHAIRESIRELSRFELFGRAEASLRDHSPHARRDLWAVARSTDVPLPARLKASAAAVAPGLAACLLSRRSTEGRRWVARQF